MKDKPKVVRFSSTAHKPLQIKLARYLINDLPRPVSGLKYYKSIRPRLKEQKIKNLNLL
jgi:hypothetical protein